MIKREMHNKDRNFEEIIDLSKHITKRLRKTTMLETKQRYTNESSHSGSCKSAALTSTSVKDKDLITHSEYVNLEIKP